MGIELDDIENIILNSLSDQPQIGFNDLIRVIESKGVNINRNVLSRHLKRLIELGIIEKQTIPGWPPSTAYKISNKKFLRGFKDRLSSTRRTLPLVVIMVVAVLAIFCITQSIKIKDLRSDLGKQNRVLNETRSELDGKTLIINRLEELGLVIDDILKTDQDGDYYVAALRCDKEIRVIKLMHGSKSSAGGMTGILTTNMGTIPADLFTSITTDKSLTILREVSSNEPIAIVLNSNSQTDN